MHQVLGGRGVQNRALLWHLAALPSGQEQKTSALGKNPYSYSTITLEKSF